MESLGARLRAARERKNLSQVQVRDKTGIHNKTLSGYENGVSDPDTDTIARLADLYGVTTDYLITGRDPSHSKADELLPTGMRQWMRANTSGLSPDEQDELAKDLADYLEFRKQKLLERRKNNRE